MLRSIRSKQDKPNNSTTTSPSTSQTLTPTATTQQRSRTSRTSYNNNNNMSSAFGIHEDALYSEISRARKRLTNGHVSLSDATNTTIVAATSPTHGGGGGADGGGVGVNVVVVPPTTAFLELWENEVSRIGDYLLAQQNNLEFSAKALLTNVEAALGGVSTSTKDKGKSKGNKNKNVNAKEARDLITTWRMKTDELVEACRKLQHFAFHNREILEEIGSYADEKLYNTGCVVGLQRRFTNSPQWKTTGPNSSLIVVLSDVYSIIRAAESRISSGDGDDNNNNAQWVAPTSFERSTTKYWVQDEQLTDLLLAAVAEAPLLVYGKSGRLTSKADCLSQRSEGDKLWDQLATPITSIYFDSPKTMALYEERLPRHEGAQLLRARWYGHKRPTGDDLIYLELKTHHEKWINTKSVKERVAIREKDMVRFLNLDGKDKKKWDFETAKNMAQVAVPTLDTAALNRAADRLLRMHDLVIRHGLRPCVRTCYLRAAFQSSASNSLRLTIDRCVTMIDETKTTSSSASKSTTSWCLEEDAVIQNTMATRVPFVVLEVKLAGDSPTPPVIQDLVTRGVIQEATKFSKFLTGAAAFNMDKIDMLPHWAEHPAFATVFSGLGLGGGAAENEMHSDSTSTTTAGSTPKIETTHAFLQSGKASSKSTSKVVAEGESSGDNATSNESNAVAASKTTTTTRRRGTFASFVSTNRLDTEMKSSSYRASSTTAGSSSAGSSSFLGGLFRRNKTKSPLGVAAKRPARVEPKTYFANERTFIQWISASLLLVTISVILLGIDSEFGDTTTYARKAGIAVCAGGVVIVFYATFVYFRRLRLISSGAPYGYVDHVGPFVLAVCVCAGVVVLLTHFLSEIRMATQGVPKTVYLHEKPGQCYLHSNRGISKLEYQPSDVVVDTKRNALLVPSVQRILLHSLDPPLPNRENRVDTLVEIPDSNLEGLTVIGDRVFALSEGPKRTELIELAWNDDDELSVIHRWKLSNSEEAEALCYVPDKTRRSGRLFIDVNRQIHIYNVPNLALPSISPEDDDEDDDSLIVGMATASEPEELERIGSLNNHVLKAGLTELKISSMFYFEGIAYVLHDNEMLLRAWDLDEGDLLAEIPLPRVEGGFSKEWEGVALERREVTDAEAGTLLFDRKGNLRASNNGEDTQSQLILHLALDTPAQVWSMVVQQGTKRGDLILPSCAVSAHAKADSISEDESSDSIDRMQKYGSG